MIAIVEQTICRNMPSAFENAHMRKEAKYTPLVNDLERKNYYVSYRPLEIGTLGHFTSSAWKVIKSLDPGLSKAEITVLILTLSKIAISFSKFIFQARSSQL